jgi:hypothetical protein
MPISFFEKGDMQEIRISAEKKVEGTNFCHCTLLQ